MHEEILVGAVLIALAAAAPAVEAKTYDAVSGYSAASNTETQRWSYRSSQSGQLDGNYTLLPKASTDTNWKNGAGNTVTLNYWSNPGFFYPLISANTAKGRLHRDYGHGPVYLPAKSIFVDPGTQIAVLSFRSPTTGAATVDFSFTDIDCHGGNGINVYVIKDSAGVETSLYGGSVFSDSSHCAASKYASTGAQSVPVSLKKGDRITFIVGNNGDYSYDSTAITASVSFP